MVTCTLTPWVFFHLRRDLSQEERLPCVDQWACLPLRSGHGCSGPLVPALANSCTESCSWDHSDQSCSGLFCRLQGMEPEIQRLMANHKAEMATAAEQAAQSTRSVQLTATYRRLPACMATQDCLGSLW